MMSDEEVQIYNYYFGKYGNKAAEEYFKSLEPTLNARAAGIIFDEMFEGKTGAEMLHGVIAGLENFGTGIKNLPNTLGLKDDDYITPTVNQMVSGSIREDLADKGPEILGSSLGQIGYDAITTISYMIPSIVASYATAGAASALGASAAVAQTAGNIAGNVLLGASAAGNEYAEMLNSGMNKEQARALSIVQGAWEGVSEYYLGAIEGLGTNKIGKIIGGTKFANVLEKAGKGTVKAVLDFFGDAATEGMEEVIQDIGSSVINGVMTDKWEFSSAEEEVYNFVLGALTAAGMNGGTALFRGSVNAAGNIGDNVKYGKMYKGDVNAQNLLVEEGLASDDGTKSKKLAEKYQSRLKSGKELTGNQLRKLINANEQAIIAEDAASIKSNVSEYLAELGETGNIDEISSAVADMLVGKEISPYQEKVLESSKYANRVINELNPENIKSGEYSTYLPKKLDTNRINPDVYGLAAEVSKNVSANESKEVSAKNNLPVPTETAKPATGDNVAENAVINAEGIIERKATDTDVSAEDTSYSALRKAINSVDNKNISKTELEFIESEYDGTMPAGDYVRGMIEGFNYGYSLPESAMNSIGNKGFYASLTDIQKKHAFSLGREAAKAKANGKNAELKAGFNGKKGHKKGTVKGEGVSLKELKAQFNDTQNKAYKVLSTLAEATGIDIVLYKSEANAEGKFTEAQGKFSHKNDTVYIDINAGLLSEADVNELGKYAMLRTFSHEFTHSLEKFSPVEYNSFREIVFAELSNRGIDVVDLIEKKMAMTEGLSFDDASREVVAEAMTDILPDSHFIQNLAEKNPNVFKRILAKLKEFLSDIKEYFANLGENRSVEANALKEEINGQMHYIESIVEAFDKVAESAVNNYQSTYAVDESASESKTVTEKAKNETVNETEKRNAGVNSAAELKERLEKFGNAEYDGIRYAVNEIELIKGKPQYQLKMTRIDGEVLGGMVTNARSLIYENMFDSREEAIETALSINLGGGTNTSINTNTEVTNNGRRNLATERQETGGETLRQDNNGGISSSDADGTGTSRLLDEVQKENVQGVGGQRKSSEPASKRGRTPERDGNRTDTADRESGRVGNGEVGDLRRDGGLLNEEVKKAQAENLKETVRKQVEQKSTEKPKGNNFVIDGNLNLPDGEKSRFRANIDAIKLVKQLETEGRYATAAEQEILSRYVGWGGLSNAFGELRYNTETHKSEMTAKKGWENEFAEFRKLVDDGVITEEEYSAASGSTKNAHYTSVEVIKAMYDGLKQLGFNGGHMLEPSSGVGNFVGAMPTSMSSKVNSWTMVELDNITGLIAKYLYPNADVRIEGFENANIPNNYMDVAIGNVPFGNYGVVDRAYPKRVTKAIHNYFFAKTLDKVRTGGIVMFITSSFTMNSQNSEIRQYIMDRADLLGAIRLPNNAFSNNAGTQVVTDILVLKKRAQGTEYAGEAFLEAPYENIGESWRGANINEYFTNHPEMVLGTPAITRGMYGAESLTYNPIEGRGTLGEQIREAFKNIDAKMDYPAKLSPEKSNFNAARENRKTKRNGFEVSKENGKVYKNVDGVISEVANSATAKRIEGLLSVRDAYRTLVNYLQQGQAENLIKKARKDLNTAYDKFVQEYGYINAQKNKSAIADDPDSYSIYALENYDTKTKKATKADIFTKDTIKPNVTVSHVDDINSGVIVSINMTGGVDASLIAKLTGKSENDITRELVDGRLAFKRKDGSLEAPERYLSGNVRAKLKEAEALAPIDGDFKNNVEELKKVIPKDIPFNDIYVTPGSPWIPAEVYADFIAEMLGGYNNPNSYRGPDVTVGRSNQTGDFKIVINNSSLKSRYQNTQKWGTNRKTFLNLIEAMMSSTSITVNDYIEDENGRKKPVVNKVETAAAQEKAEEIAREFQDWIWRDETRRNELASLYNETYNALVSPKYNGENLTVNGLNAEFSLRKHQADAVQRIISSGGNTLLAHKVGAGKTLEMATAAMKLKELGIVKKPMFVVPKSLVAQWGSEFKSYFPASKLLVSDEKSFEKANRKVFSNNIANGDFDAVIVSYEQFEKIPMSKDFQKQFYQQQIDEIIAAIAEEKAESSGRGITVKEMEKKKAQLEKKIAELTTKSKDEDNIDFEQLGIDSLFVDEAHNFKNLQYVTRMNNISGLGNTNGSQRAFDLYTKIRYMQQLNGGRGVVFATATPVMNSMAELYIMQKYLQSDMLNQLGLTTFDAWAKQFGEVVNAVEIKPSGQGFRVKQTFSNFRNLNELQLLFRSFADVLTQVPDLKIPKMKGGKVQVVECEPGEFQRNYMKELEKRADNVKNVDPTVDNMLKITSDGRKVSYTQRMIDPSLPYEPGCKIFRCCDNVIKEYKDSKATKGTQIIFCDASTPKGKSKTVSTATEIADTEVDTESARLYDDMKAYLIKKGIPAEEIAFIHDADTDVKKRQLFEDVNDGKVRVLIGSTGKMGVGMNAQKRIVAIHHLDAPWRPGDVEQRDGRAFRQKNMNDEVTKYTYVTVGSFDARMWDILDRKQHFISQIMNGEDVGRSAEDTGDVTLSAAEVKALASGNPLIKESVELNTALQKLEDLQRAYKSSIVNAKAKQLDDIQRISILTNNIENGKADIKARIDTYSDGKFSMEIGGTKYTDKKEAGAALFAEIASKTSEGETVSIGRFAGFELKASKQRAEYSGYLVGNNNYKFNVYTSNTTQMINRLCDIAKGIEGKVSEWENTRTELDGDLAAQEKMIAEPFAKQDELEQKRKRFNEIMAELNPPEEQQITDDTEQAQSREYLNIYDYSKSFAEQIDDYKKGIIPRNDTLLVSGTPEIWQKVGFNALPVTINQTHVDYALNGTKDYDHLLGEQLLKMLPEAIKEPLAIIQSQTRPDRAVVILQMEHNNKKVVTAVEVDGIGLQNNDGINSNALTTLFAKGNAISQLKTAVENTINGKNELFYWNKKEALTLLQAKGLQLPSSLPGEDFVNSIRNNSSNVKTKFNDVTESLQFKRWFGKSKAVNNDGSPRILYHRTNADFTVFDIDRSGTNQGKTHGDGIYLSTGKDAFDYAGDKVMQLYASIKHPFEMYLTKNQAERIYDKYFKPFHVDKYNTYRPHVIQSLQSATKVFDYLTEAAETNGIKTSDILSELGYDGIHDGIEWVAFAENQVKSVTDNIGTYSKYSNDIRYQERTSPLTDREILEYAASEIRIDDLTPGEKSALDIFQNRLTKLRDLQEKRTELGKLYKEQQFGSEPDRNAAIQTHNRMQVVDGQIKTASSELLSVEEKEVLKRVLQKSRKVIEETERVKSDERLKRWRERRNSADEIKKYRERVKADVDELTSWILKPDNKDVTKHIPDALKNTVIPFLTSIDFTSKRQLKGGEATKADKEFVKQLNAIKGAIKTNIDVNGMYSGYNDLPADFMDNLQSFIDAVQGLVDNNSGEFVINQMSGAELKDLSKIVRTLKKFITQMNKFHANAMFSHVYEAGGNTYSTLKGMKNAGKQTNGVNNFLMWQNMRPAYAFERFGEGGKAIYDEFRRAQATLAFNSKKIIKFAEQTYTDKEVKAWEKEQKVFNLGGDDVSIPVSFIMAFYELSKQPDSLRHILGEGVRVATYKSGNLKKVSIADVGHALTQQDVETIVNSLTDRQKDVADKLQQYMATQGAEWGNYVSMKRFGEEMFTNQQYFPINSDGRHLDATAAEFPSNASLYALLNMSFTKQRNEEANNRIILYSIFDVFANHMASMAQYNAFALPILDSLKWFNYKETAFDTEGNRVVLGNIREEMARVYGTPEESRPGSGREGYAETFIKNIIKAYNGTETQGIATDEPGFKALRRYNMAQIAYNARVVVQQPLAIVRAGLLIDYRSILRGIKSSARAVRKNIAEMYEHSGIATWKSFGFYDINISRGLTDMIKHHQSFIEKFGEIGMVGAEKADEITWAAMWSACKEEVSRKQRNLKFGSDAYFEAVTNLFEEVIYKTQVVDSVLTKTEFMRSKGFFSKAISSFMSEPSTTASMVLDAYHKVVTDFQKGMPREQVWQKNKKNILRTMAAYGISALLLAAVTALVDAWRDNDEEKDYQEKYTEAFIGNLVDEGLPFNKLPIVSDMYDLAKMILSKIGVDTYGNSPQTLFMQWSEYLVKSVEIFYDKITGENTGYTVWAGVKKLLQAVSGLTGFPIATITRTLSGLWNHFVGANVDSLKIKYYNPSSEVKEYLGYIESGDIQKANEFYNKWLDDKEAEIVADRKADGKKELTEKEVEKKAKSSVKSSVSAKYREAYIEAYKKKDDEAMAQIRKEMYATGLYGSVDAVIETCRNWLKEYK